MKHKTTIDIPATKKEVVDFTTCDLCGNKIKSSEGYIIDELEMRVRIGNVYYGGHGEDTEIDLCGKCFDEKLVQWYIDQGFNPMPRDLEY